MELPTFMYGALPSKKREELVSKRNARIIKEFFREREKLKVAKEGDLTRLKQLHKNKSINRSIYRRLRRIMNLTYEQKRIDLVQSITEKSVRIRKSVSSHDNQPSESNAESN